MSGVAATALLFSVPALAQSSANTGAQIQLETISVQGEAPDENGESAAAGTETATGPVKGYVASKSTTGSKSDTPVTAIPQAVSVIGREEIDDRKATKVDEALRYTAGVTAQAFGPDPDTDWFFIRGFQATQTGVFLDGLPLFAHGFGGFQIDPFLLERIEVLKGPASVLYGGSNPGGIINLISKRPLDKPFGYAETGINNWGNAYLGLDFGAVAGEQSEWSYRFTGRISGGDQYTDYSEDFRGSLLPQLTYQPTDETKVTVYAHYSALDQVHVGGGFLPYVGTVVDAPYGKIDREAFYGEPSIDEQDRAQFMLGYEFEHRLENAWRLTSNTRYGRMTGSQSGPYGYGYVSQDAQGNPVGGDYRLFRIGFDESTEVNTFLTDNRLDGEFDTGALNHSALVGVDYKYFNIDHVQASGWGITTPIDIVNPVYGVPQAPNNVYLDQDLTQHQVGAYIQDQIRFGSGWLATLNGRYDYVEAESISAPGFSPNYRTDDTALSGRIGLAYEFANGLTPYASAATFFNPIFEANTAPGGDEPFAPEEGYQFEAGFKYQPTFMDALLTASAFHIVKQNVLVPAPAPGNPSAQGQFGEVTSTGVEVEGKFNITENFQALAAFTAYDLEITEDTRAAYIGKTPYIVPEVMASLWLDYTIAYGAFEGVGFGAGVRYIGETWVDNENTLKVPDVALLDAAIRYEKNDWGVALNVTNLFDEKYVKACQGINSCGYGDSRTITLSAHYKW
jgi:iron complex outermembrane receptor protein